MEIVIVFIVLAWVLRQFGTDCADEDVPIVHSVDVLYGGDE